MSRPPMAFNEEKLFKGATNDLAIVLAGTQPIIADNKGQLKLGERQFNLDAPAIHDGVIVANGRIYVATAAGKLHCIGLQ
jgi:hypothetical protein